MTNWCIYNSSSFYVFDVACFTPTQSMKSDAIFSQTGTPQRWMLHPIMGVLMLSVFTKNSAIHCSVLKVNEEMITLWLPTCNSIS